MMTPAPFAALVWLVRVVGEPTLAYVAWATGAVSIVVSVVAVIERRLWYLFVIAAVLSAFTGYVGVVTIGVAVWAVTATQLGLAVGSRRRARLWSYGLHGLIVYVALVAVYIGIVVHLFG